MKHFQAAMLLQQFDKLVKETEPAGARTPIT